MDRWKLVFEFDGTNFSGWQKQPDTRTVQDVIEKAFSTLYQQKIDITAQGRTDAGVHAEYMPAHADLPRSFNSNRLLHALKGLLPADVALTEAQITDSEFHARFDAKSRMYRYQLSLKPSPLLRNFVWQVYGELNFNLLENCAELLIGTHNFINFCMPPENEEATTICEVYKSEWKQEGKLLIYRIEANRFLRHMVRRLAGSMVNTAGGRSSIEEFSALLNSSEMKQKGFSAPPQGLILENVKY